MADLMAKNNSKIKSFKLGDVIEGTVVEILPKSLILNIGGKSEGVVAEKAFEEARDFIKTLKVGDKVKGEVIVSETRMGNTIVSLRHSAKESKWQEIEKAYGEEREVVCEVMSASGAGAMVSILGVNGFLPASLMGKETAKDTSKMIGERIKVKIIELNKEENRLVVSEREVTEKELIADQKKTFDKIKEGETYEGVVTQTTSFGVFVSFRPDTKSESVEGLVHISEMSWGKTKNTKENLEEGDGVKVKVISKGEVKRGKNKIALSIKQAIDDPWQTVSENYKVDQKIEGVVTKQADYGYFVELEPGIEGLLHITKVPPETNLKTGDSVKCFIEEIDEKTRKISLGISLTVKPLLYK